MWFPIDWVLYLLVVENVPFAAANFSDVCHVTGTPGTWTQQQVLSLSAVSSAPTCMVYQQAGGGQTLGKIAVSHVFTIQRGANCNVVVGVWAARFSTSCRGAWVVVVVSGRYPGTTRCVRGYREAMRTFICGVRLTLHTLEVSRVSVPCTLQFVGWATCTWATLSRQAHQHLGNVGYDK